MPSSLNWLLFISSTYYSYLKKKYLLQYKLKIFQILYIYISKYEISRKLNILSNKIFFILLEYIKLFLFNILWKNRCRVNCLRLTSFIVIIYHSTLIGREQIRIRRSGYDYKTLGKRFWKSSMIKKKKYPSLTNCVYVNWF